MHELQEKPLRIGIVANEPSGDLLGASLIKAIRKQVPNAQFEGVGGPGMIAQGCQSFFAMEKLTVMGLVEVAKHLPELLRLRRQLERHFSANPPDVFIGIDAPDFNLALETTLKEKGIPTVHFVSPTVWAWRSGRVNKIRKAVDLLLCIFPFEEKFLLEHDVPAIYVGHPLADEIPLENDRSAARLRIGIDETQTTIALLPGSRMSEVRSLSETFLRTADICRQQRSDIKFIVPLVNASTKELFKEEWQRVMPDLPVIIVDAKARDAMLAADVVLTASGTATLEGLLLKRPMVVAYRLHWLTYWIVKTFNLVKIPYIAMANLLAEEEVAPEFVQHEVTPEALAKALMEILDSPQRMVAIEKTYMRVHKLLRQDAAAKAATAVLNLVQNKKP